MSAKAIREYDGKLLLAYWLLRSPLLFKESQDSASKFLPPPSKVTSITFNTSILQDATISNPQVTFENHVQQTFN
ncbi:5605_t:CDS:1, partial [Cetraspora pellucida]